MEKQHQHETDLHDDKVDAATQSAARDVGLGQMLEVQATPEQERKVLWKLDLMYVSF